MVSNYNRRSGSSGSRSKQDAREGNASQTNKKTTREGSKKTTRQRSDHPDASRVSARPSTRMEPQNTRHTTERSSEQRKNSRSSVTVTSSRSRKSNATVSSAGSSSDAKSQNIKRVTGGSSSRSSQVSTGGSGTAPQSPSSRRRTPPRSSSTIAAVRRSPSRDGGGSLSETRRSRDKDANRYGPQRTVGEYRERRSSKPRGKLLFVSGIICITLFILGGAFAALYFSSVFMVTTINVKGNSRVSTEQVLALASISDGTTLLRVNADSIASRISQSPWIDSVQIERAFPSTLVLSVTEADIVAVVKVDPASTTQGSVYWLVSSHNTWIEQIDSRAASALYGTATGTSTIADNTFSLSKSVVSDASITGTETASLPLIKDLTIGLSPSSGATITDAGLLNALTMLDAFSTEFASRIKTISASDAESTSFILNDGVEVAFGAAVDVAQKEKVVSALLNQYANAISYINVRIVSRPSWRGITVSS